MNGQGSLPYGPNAGRGAGNGNNRQQGLHQVFAGPNNQNFYIFQQPGNYSVAISHGSVNGIGNSQASGLLTRAPPLQPVFTGGSNAPVAQDVAGRGNAIFPDTPMNAPEFGPSVQRPLIRPAAGPLLLHSPIRSQGRRSVVQHSPMRPSFP